MESNTSAVIDVTTENKNITSILRDEIKDYEAQSTFSASRDNSLVQSPSIESFSTFQDVETISELNMDHDSDLCVRIDNPQKHLDTLETYITFRITTKVARIEYSENEYIVRRRYNDFIWLRQRLVETYPMHIVPPLPGKHSLIGQLDRYSKEFILTRMSLLNIFINRAINHPILSCDLNLKIFLTAKQSEFTMHRKSKSNVFNKMSDSFQNMSAVYSVKNRSTEFEKAKEYVHILSEKLLMIEKISSRINKERQDYVTELNNFHPVLTVWSGTEPPLTGLLLRMARAIEQTAISQNQLIGYYNGTIGNPLRDFSMYIDVVKDVLNKRDSYQIVYENSIDDLSRKRAEKDQLVLASHGQGPVPTPHFSIWKQPTSDQKLEKLGTTIPQLVKQTESLQDRLECANEALRSDLARWQLEKQAYLKQMLIEFANKQIEYYQQCVSAWENVVTENNSNQEISVIAN